MGTYEWVDEAKVNGKPLFKKKASKGETYYLYCSSVNGTWVITDDKEDIDSNLCTIKTTSAASLPTIKGLIWKYYRSDTDDWAVEDNMTCSPVNVDKKVKKAPLIPPGTKCSYCQVEPAKKCCRKCESVYYCSKQCMTKARPGHARECPRLKKMKNTAEQRQQYQVSVYRVVKSASPSSLFSIADINCTTPQITNTRLFVSGPTGSLYTSGAGGGPDGQQVSRATNVPEPGC